MNYSSNASQDTIRRRGLTGITCAHTRADQQLPLHHLDRKNIREDIWRIKSALWTEILFKRYARSTTLEREGNPVVRYDTNALAANQPIEDREADVIVQGPDGE